MMPPRPRLEDVPMKRVAAAGCKLPAQLPAGEILTDITQNKWKLGNPIGYGGFGDIYLASNDVASPVGEDAKYVVKIEPHNNGPLFVEMNFYIRAARKHMIECWCESRGQRRIGVPTYEGSGSHIYGDQRYRFLVIPRYGIDIGKLFLSHRKKLPTKLVNSLAVQMLDALEYIHSKGYAHADVKGPNILLSYGDGIKKEKFEAYLVDYGLAYRFYTGSGKHKPFVHDERRAHEGTLEFTSRDGHHGTHSRRGDIETLGYNIIQWLCGKLPWEKDSNEMCVMNPEEVHQQKEFFLSDLSLFMDKCFPHKKRPPAALMKYMKYVTELEFETKPNYTYLKNLFRHGGRQNNNIPSCLCNIKESNENLATYMFFERPYLRERKPCRPMNGEIRVTRNTQPKQSVQKKEFSWEEVLALHPDKLAKSSIQPPPSPLTPPLTPPTSLTSSLSSPSLPTYAMLDVLRKMKERQSGSFRHKGTPKSSDNELKPRWMTPAMEEIARKKNTETLVSTTNPQSASRVTRSSGKLKRLGAQKRKQRNDDSTHGNITHKRSKGSSS